MLLFILAALLLLPSAVQAKQLAIVTDAANPASNFSSDDLLKILNLRTHTWPDGKPIIVVVRDPSVAAMQVVLHKVFNMSVDQAHAFIQAHKGSIMVADSDQAVIRFVASNWGAIGVVDVYSLTNEVHVVKVDGKLPFEQGYLLKGNEP